MKYSANQVRNKKTGETATVLVSLPSGEILATYRRRGILSWRPDSRAFSYVKRVTGVDNVWLQSVQGGQARQMTRFTDGRIGQCAWSKEGRLAVARYSTRSDAVLIENFR